MDKINIKIRKAEESDYIDVNSLYYQTYNLYSKNLPQSYKKTPKEVLSRGTFIDLLDDKNTLFIIAEVAKKVVGLLYAGVETCESDKVVKGYRRISIYEFSVSPKFTNKGIGTSLLQTAEKWATDKGIKELIVLTYAFNKRAISFYEKNNFIPYSIQLDKKIND